MESPKPSTQDYILKITKGALGAIPFAGSLLGELLEMFVVPKQQKKMEEWFGHVEQTLTELTENGGISKEEIFNDENFTSIFQKTSRVYANNVEAHKKPLLQSYLKASITKPIPLDKKYIFLDIIDKLTESQLLILKDVYDNESSDNYQYQKGLEKILVNKYAEGDKQYLVLLIKGLQDFHLLSYGSAKVVVENENQWHMVTSKIAKEFMEFLNA
jgi:hypothetical protein